MSEETSSTTGTARERVILALAFLTSEECQAACCAVLPAEKLAYAWCRLWFDEIYIPSTRYLDGIKGDQSEEAVRRFRSCFTAEERAALERFHRFLELRIDMLPDAARRHAVFPQRDAWDHVIRHAAYVLDDLTADPAALHHELDGLVHALQRDARTEDAPGLAASFRDVLRP